MKRKRFGGGYDVANQNREKLLALFAKRQGEFLSGQQIADLLGLSRTAVWKHMESLRNEGFEIEAVRNKGYRLVKNSDSFSKDSILIGLHTKFMGQKLYFYDEVDSTQFVAHQKISEGATSGTVVVSELQTSGKGRLARVWDSQSGKGIWMSVILKPQIAMQKVPQFTFIASLAVATAIEEITKLEPQIKWPNDIYIGRQKVCGVLTEMRAEAASVEAVIIGIGINVNQMTFPVEIQEKATSLALQAGHAISRTALIQEILKQLEKYYQLFMAEGFRPIKLLWEDKAIPFGEKITVSTMQGQLAGFAEGISDDGVLLVRDESNVLHQIYSADIDFNS
ncbi:MULTISPECIES: biotin--[acetyl-CoA-carboxylase] ligase [Listeria]|uniref:biotin--[acetyl-CoA-carboxylase] ligase n=1 Tax=Listeria TaxID=1637 RepID=UPI000B5905AE|nr:MULTISPECIES: biotin--[acetyl-CoA-carboxylase] ligase [Listeria]